MCIRDRIASTWVNTRVRSPDGIGFKLSCARAANKRGSLISFKRIQTRVDSFSVYRETVFGGYQFQWMWCHKPPKQAQANSKATAAHRSFSVRISTHQTNVTVTNVHTKANAPISNVRSTIIPRQTDSTTNTKGWRCCRVRFAIDGGWLKSSPRQQGDFHTHKSTRPIKLLPRNNEYATKITTLAALRKAFGHTR